MTVHEFIQRATAQTGKGAVYRFGGGRTTPYGSSPLDETRGCDCSAFVCWCARIEKYQGHQLWWLKKLNDGWLNTDGIWVDAVQHRQGFFDELEKPEIGAIAVYPASHVAGVSGPKIGHTGIVTHIEDDVVTGVIHCSSSNYRNYGDAIYMTDNSVFRGKKALRYVWPASVTP